MQTIKRTKICKQDFRAFFINTRGITQTRYLGDLLMQKRGSALVSEQPVKKTLVIAGQ
jgi:hypothetical protein